MKALLLLSGGFDSPVAYHLMKNHVEIEAIHFHPRNASDVAARLVYLPRGEFPRLRDDELRRLHGIARPLVPGSGDDPAVKR